jgi:hypothetical protein
MRGKNRNADDKSTRGARWDHLADIALGATVALGVVAGGLHLWAWAQRREADRVRAAELDDSLASAADQTEIDPGVIEAAALLGISPMANRADVRAALRTRLSTDAIHPDQGGDAEAARRLIEARDLLLAHLDRTEQST